MSDAMNSASILLYTSEKFISIVADRSNTLPHRTHGMVNRREGPSHHRCKETLISAEYLPNGRNRTLS
jgi:hypothetical protein